MSSPEILKRTWWWLSPFEAQGGTNRVRSQPGVIFRTSKLDEFQMFWRQIKTSTREIVSQLNRLSQTAGIEPTTFRSRVNRADYFCISLYLFKPVVTKGCTQLRSIFFYLSVLTTDNFRSADSHFSYTILYPRIEKNIRGELGFNPGPFPPIANPIITRQCWNITIVKI